MLSVEINVDGLNLNARQAFGLLQQIQPELARQTVSEMKTAAGPAIRSVQARIPEQPMRGWMHRGRTGWLTQNPRSAVRADFTRGRVNTSTRDTFPLLTIVQPTAAGAIFDLARNPQPPSRDRRGRRRTDTQNRAFVNNLATYGPPSRSMWPGVLAAIPEVEAALAVAVKSMETALNARLD